MDPSSAAFDLLKVAFGVVLTLALKVISDRWGRARLNVVHTNSRFHAPHTASKVKVSVGAKEYERVTLCDVSISNPSTKILKDVKFFIATDAPLLDQRIETAPIKYEACFDVVSDGVWIRIPEMNGKDSVQAFLVFGADVEPACLYRGDHGIKVVRPVTPEQPSWLAFFMVALVGTLPGPCTLIVWYALDGGDAAVRAHSLSWIEAWFFAFTGAILFSLSYDIWHELRYRKRE
jgi:hypothetical protein